MLPLLLLLFVGALMLLLMMFDGVLTLLLMFILILGSLEDPVVIDWCFFSAFSNWRLRNVSTLI